MENKVRKKLHEDERVEDERVEEQEEEREELLS